MDIQTKTGQPFGGLIADTSPHIHRRAMNRVSTVKECEVCGTILTKREATREQRKRSMLCAECRSEYNDFVRNGG